MLTTKFNANQYFLVYLSHQLLIMCNFFWFLRSSYLCLHLTDGPKHLFKNINKSLPSRNHRTKGIQCVVIQGHSLEFMQSSTFSWKKKKSSFKYLNLSGWRSHFHCKYWTFFQWNYTWASSHQIRKQVHLIEVPEMMVNVDWQMPNILGLSMSRKKRWFSGISLKIARQVGNFEWMDQQSCSNGAQLLLTKK